MTAKINVVNFALNLLGAESITSLEDEAREAQVMKNLYYISRDAVLSEAEWTFATRRFIPPKLAAQPEWGWANAFAIPSDIIRVTRVDRTDVVGVLASELTRRPAAYEVEGRNILTNEDSIFCKGIRRIDDEGIYSPLFDEAFGYKLAAQACLMLTESNQKLSAMASLYTEAIAKAKSRDGMQGSTRRMRNRTFQRARS